jgi:hypothetical protein
MNELEARVENALDATKELIVFFVRVRELQWPAHFHPIADALAALDVDKAIQMYERIPKVNMGGLLDLFICKQNGHTTQDETRDNQLYLRLVGQLSTTLDNLHQYTTREIFRPLVAIEKGA